MKIDEIKELMKAMEDHELSAFDYKEGDVQLSLRRGAVNEYVLSTGALAPGAPAAVAAAAEPIAAVSVPGAQASHGEEVKQDTDAARTELPAGNIVKSPLVGTFYSAPSPDDAPYVAEGDTVKKGQVLGIIEAMKLMNEVESEFAGTIAEILVKNGETVEYGQPLFRIV